MHCKYMCTSVSLFSTLRDFSFPKVIINFFIKTSHVCIPYIHTDFENNTNC